MAIILSLGATATQLISLSCACSVAETRKVVIGMTSDSSGKAHSFKVMSTPADIANVGLWCNLLREKKNDKNKLNSEYRTGQKLYEK